MPFALNPIRICLDSAVISTGICRDKGIGPVYWHRKPVRSFPPKLNEIIMLLVRIELTTSPLPRHDFSLHILKLLAFSLPESRRVAIRSHIFRASGTGN